MVKFSYLGQLMFNQLDDKTKKNIIDCMEDKRHLNDNVYSYIELGKFIIVAKKDKDNVSFIDDIINKYTVNTIFGKQKY